MDCERAGARLYRKFCKDLFVEGALLLVMVGYFLVAASQNVGEDLHVTAAGVGLMALWSWWTLSTVSDGLKWLACRARMIQG